VCEQPSPHAGLLFRFGGAVGLCAQRPDRDVEELLAGTAQTVRDAWAPEANLDEFFTRMYRYYHAKGFPSMLASTITNLMCVVCVVHVCMCYRHLTTSLRHAGSMWCFPSHWWVGWCHCSTLAFTVTFSTFLLVFVQWTNLLTCGEGGGVACQVRRQWWKRW